ncbi:aldo/keto reductase [Akkermansiaceae bacterium]|nr:aldo/keto reductase [Akkermansiaceae bacterium]
MKIVEILPGISTSALGFGCAPILGSVDAQTSRKALGVALDCGVTHFDLARSYGYGQAERFVGKFLTGRRAEVTIATKFGIEATGLATLLSPVKPLVRALKGKLQGRPEKSWAPAATGSAAHVADFFHRRPELEAAFMRKSFEKSLRELGTDYVDFLFIHEPLSSIRRVEELKELAAKLKKEGKLRAFGLAYMQDQSDLHLDYLAGFDLQQFNNSPDIDGYERILASRSDSPNIFFSPFRHSRECESHADVLSKLSKAFPRSVTLCSMFNPEHIVRNAAALQC